MNTPDWLTNIGDRHISSVAHAQDYIESHLLKHHATHGFGMFSLVLKPGIFVGMAGFVKRDYLPHPDLGLALLPEYYRQGLATEASERLIQLAWQEYDLSEILAITIETNFRSQRLMERLEFEPLGEFISPAGDKLLKYRRTLFP